MDFVTKRMEKRSTSCVDLSSVSISDASMGSCNSTMKSPSLDTSANCAEITRLKLKLEQFTLEMDGAQMEIDILTSENEQLKMELLESRSIIDNLKKVGIPDESTPKGSSSKKSSKKSKRAKNIKEFSKTLFDKNLPLTQTENNNITQNTQTKEAGTQTTPTKERKETQVFRDESNDKSFTLNREKLEKCVIKRKICIVSDDNKNKIVNNAIDIFENDIICHYSYPGCGIENLFENLKGKLENYSFNDYCIMLIGGSDFNVTKNYHSMVEYIREQLETITNTNVVLCCPNFRYGPNVNLFNHRIEIFNNLLYLDVMTHEHAYFMDSNRNLTYSFRMFNKSNSSINIIGIRTILLDMKTNIRDIECSYENESRMFFRES